MLIDKFKYANGKHTDLNNNLLTLKDAIILVIGELQEGYDDVAYLRRIKTVVRTWRNITGDLTTASESFLCSYFSMGCGHVGKNEKQRHTVICSNSGPADISTMWYRVGGNCTYALTERGAERFKYITIGVSTDVKDEKHPMQKQRRPVCSNTQYPEDTLTQTCQPADVSYGFLSVTIPDLHEDFMKSASNADLADVLEKAFRRAQVRQETQRMAHIYPCS